jgi:cytochrome d ubiquinol oxidase subunit II
MTAEFFPPGTPPMLFVVLAFLGVSLFLYCLLGGADFGAGVLELFLGKDRRQSQRKIIDKAMGPMWEANHMWLILMVVILFVGFPAVYTRVSINLHIPLTAMLLGVIMRGTSFTFRHYDAVKDGSQRAYTGFFIFSSVWTPFFLGVTMGALVPGGIDPAVTGSAESYAAGYIDPWLRPFPLALGAFTVCLFAFVAAVYLIGESPAGELRRSFVRKTFWGAGATVVAGAAVFAAAQLDGVPLLHEFLATRTATSAMLLATILFPWLAIAVLRDWIWTGRLLVGVQVALILAGWLRVQYPVLVKMPGGDLTFFNAHAPAATLNQLGGALLVGSVFILPALAWLFRVFKTSED